MLESADEVLCYRRGDHVVAANLAEHDAPLPSAATAPVIVATKPDAASAGRLAALSGAIVRG